MPPIPAVFGHKCIFKMPAERLLCCLIQPFFGNDKKVPAYPARKDKKRIVFYTPGKIGPVFTICFILVFYLKAVPINFYVVFHAQQRIRGKHLAGIRFGKARLHKQEKTCTHNPCCNNRNRDKRRFVPGKIRRNKRRGQSRYTKRNSSFYTPAVHRGDPPVRKQKRLLIVFPRQLIIQLSNGLSLIKSGQTGSSFQIIQEF